MLETTGGVNTHRGAIWALGLLVTASAMHEGSAEIPAITGAASRLARLEDTACPAVFSKGRYVTHRYRCPARAGKRNAVSRTSPGWRCRNWRKAGSRG